METLAAGCLHRMKRKGKVGVGRLGDYCKPGRRQQELGVRKIRRVGVCHV